MGLSGIAGALAARMLGGWPVRLPRAFSIGMAAHGNAETTRAALDMLFEAASGEFELILVDDRSPDGTLEVFQETRKRHANTRVFSFPENLEYCHSVNAFLSHAHGEQLLFVSNDIFVNPSYLRALLGEAAAARDWGILRGSSNFVDLESALHNVPFEGECTRQTLFEFSAGVAASVPAGAVEERYLVGDAFLVARRLIERIGTFDTRFTGYCGDADFGLRAQIAGFRVALVPRAFAYHAQHANITYLPPEAQQEKLALRFARASEALRVLLQKYRVTEQGINIDQIPWERLRATRFEPAAHYVAPLNYSRYEIQ
jgi:GT2 family glycosyltransferase